MEYRATCAIRCDPSRVWNALKDVRHFACNDPFHHDFAFLTARKFGVGTAFKIRHTYFPVFPLASDEVVCTITQWEPARGLTLLEKNRKRYRTHAQRFELFPRGTDTIVEYTISYNGVPPWLIPFAQWVRWLVTRRMKEKLAEIAERCEELSQQAVLRAAPRQHAA